MAAIRLGLSFLQGARRPGTAAGALDGAFIVAQNHGSDLARTVVLLGGNRNVEEMDAKAAKERLRVLIEERNWLWMREGDLLKTF